MILERLILISFEIRHAIEIDERARQQKHASEEFCH